jgi:hypothetical protein
MLWSELAPIAGEGVKSRAEGRAARITATPRDIFLRILEV